MKYVILILFLSLGAASHAEIDPGDNTPLPDLGWSNGQTQQHLYALESKPKILHFWAAWCIPCRDELPDMIEWRENNPDITVLALSLDQRIAQTQHFIKKFKLDMPPLRLDEDDSQALGVPVVPYTIFVSHDNRFVGSYLGIAPWNDAAFSEQVRALLLGK